MEWDLDGVASSDVEHATSTEFRDNLELAAREGLPAFMDRLRVRHQQRLDEEERRRHRFHAWVAVLGLAVAGLGVLIQIVQSS